VKQGVEIAFGFSFGGLGIAVGFAVCGCGAAAVEEYGQFVENRFGGVLLSGYAG
jgi:hypothetical protein